MSHSAFTPRHSELEAKLTQSLLHLNRISEVFCASPFVLTTRNRRVKCFLQIMVAAIYWLTALILAQEDLLENQPQRIGFEQFLFVCRYGGSLFICATVFVGCQRQVRRYPDLVKRIVDIHLQVEKHSKFRSNEPFRRLGLFINCLLSANIMLVVAVCIIDLASVDFDFYVAFVDLIRLIMPIVVASLPLTQFIALLYILSSEYSSLNQVIGDSFNNGPTWKSRDIRVVYSVTPALLRQNNHKTHKRNDLNCARHLHLELAEIYNEGTASIGILLISVFVQTFLQILIQMYLWYRYAVNLKAIDSIQMTYTILWIPLNGGPLLSVLYVCDRLSKEVRNRFRKLYMILKIQLVYAQMNRSTAILLEVDSFGPLLSEDHTSNVCVIWQKS